MDSQFLNDIFGGDFHSTAVEAADLQQERMEVHTQLSSPHLIVIVTIGGRGRRGENQSGLAK